MIIKTEENIDSLALAYYDEVNKVLKEVNSDDFYFTLSPFSSEYKRLYIIGDLIYNDVINIYAEDVEGFSVKITQLDTFNSYTDFDNALSYLTCVYDNKYLNSIPIDILITSESINEKTIDLKLNISDEILV